MEKAKKINLLDATDRPVYHDDFGWVDNYILFHLEGKVMKNGRLVGVYNGLLEEAYVETEGGEYKMIRELNLSNRQLFALDGKELFCKGFYPYHEYAKIKQYKIKATWKDREITKKDRIEVYEGGARDLRIQPYQIREGLRIQVSSKSKGTYVVTEVPEQPNREGILCIVRPIGSKGTFKVTLDDPLTSVPYEEYEEAPDELSIFNQPLAEGELAPFVEHSKIEASQKWQANLYWQPIADASNYTVSLYKFRNDKTLRYQVYLLERFEVARNTHWLTLQNLLGKGYVAVLEAEDRAGAIIARTRGINLDSGKAEWF